MFRHWLAGSAFFLFVIGCSVSADAVAKDIYQYDSLGRVTFVSSTGGSQDYYAYDSSGNRTVTRRSTFNLPSVQDKLLPNEALVIDSTINSADRRFELVLQEDSNLVLYGPSGPLWWTGVPRAVNLVMQGDGNLVLYAADGTPVWSTGTYGHPGTRLVLQGDGNLVMYDGDTPIWASNTSCGSC